MAIGSTAVWLTAAACAQSPPAPVWSTLRPLPDATGVAGCFAGTSGVAGEPGVLVVAGGANFPDGSLWSGGKKVWHSRAFVLPTPDGEWIDAGPIPRPLGYGVSASYGGRVWCVGGGDAAENVSTTFALRWDAAQRDLVVEPDSLPPLPRPTACGAGVLVGSRLYVSGGLERPDAREALRGMWSIDLAAPASERCWREHPPCPGPGRVLPVMGTSGGKVFLVGGAEPVADPNAWPARRFLADAHAYDPATDHWETVAEPPVPVVAAPSPAFSLPDGKLLFLPGNDFELYRRERELADRHPGFPRTLRVFDPGAGTWSDGGTIPEELIPVVTTPTVVWQGDLIVPSGESRPCVRTPQMMRLRLTTSGSSR
jgi:N-acetylneuraminic acid mutarotase